MITSLIFFPDPAYPVFPPDLGLEYEDVRLEVAPGVRLAGWYLPAKDARGVILFSHGNAGNLSHRLDKARGWVQRGYAVLLWDYRGYGSSGGSIASDEELAADAELYFRWLVEKKGIPEARVIFYGESLGSFAAVRLGASHRGAAVVLEAPFPSFQRLAMIHYPWMPPFLTGPLLRSYAFAVEDWVARLKTPLFVLHGTADEICPLDLSQKLFERAPDPKEFFAVPGGGHNDLPDVMKDAYWDKPAAFLASHQA